MVIKNANVYTQNGVFQEGEICIQDGVFAESGQGGIQDGEVVDAEGCYALPGLIDLHFHGCMGYDFCDGTQEAFAKIAAYEASVGVTGIAPAMLTLPEKELERILRAAAAEKALRTQEPDARMADLIGINMEGPFISRVKKGAQDERYMAPCSVETMQRFLDASGGLVSFIGIAPEENPGFVDFIRQMKGKVHVSLAHTNADYDTAMRAFAAGADHAVHLYNAMPPFTHRQPGVVGAVADSPHVYAELICDGMHIHPSVVRATFQMLGPDRIVFISDSMRATGMADGRYRLGELDVEVEGKRALLVSDGSLAGSVTNLMDCMRTAVLQMGIPLEQAVACATVNPAKCLGVYGTRGSITVGKKADVVLLDKGLNLRMVVKDGECIS